MLRQLILFICFLKVTNCWTIEAEPNTVTSQLTPNVTIQCHDDINDVITPITDLYRIRVMKYNDKDNAWDTVAEMSSIDRDMKTSFVDAKVSGLVDKPNNSYIKIHFNIANDDVIGQFMCEVDGLDGSRKMHVISTKPVAVNEHGISYPDVLKILLDLKIQEKGDHSDLKEWMVEMSNAIRNVSFRVETAEAEHAHRENVMFATLANLTDRFERRSIDVTKEIANINQNIEIVVNKQKDIEELIDILHLKNPAESWPVGPISLLKPAGGCPDSPSVTWRSTSMRYVLKNGNNGYEKETSKELNLFGDVFKNFNDKHFIHMEMCSKVTPESQGQSQMTSLSKVTEWPKGQYCIFVNSYDNGDGKCPTPFTRKTINYGTFDDNSGAIVIDDIDDNVATSNFVQWCCREDGKITDPVVLPTLKPFYLLSMKFGYHDPNCQVVVGMSVSKQWFEIDAKDDDHSAHGRLFHFCYYSPTK